MVYILRQAPFINLKQVKFVCSKLKGLTRGMKTVPSGRCSDVKRSDRGERIERNLRIKELKLYRGLLENETLHLKELS